LFFQWLKKQKSLGILKIQGFQRFFTRFSTFFYDFPNRKKRGFGGPNLNRTALNLLTFKRSENFAPQIAPQKN